MVIEFNEQLKIDKDYETIAFDPGMKANVLGERSMGGGLVEVFLEWSEFVLENSQKMVPNWPDHKGKGKLKWNQTQFYPADHQTRILVKSDDRPYDELID